MAAVSIASLRQAFAQRQLARAEQMVDAKVGALQVQLNPATVGIGFSGAMTVGMPGTVEVPFPCYIDWVHMFALDDQLNAVAVSAQVDLQLAHLPTFGASRRLWGTVPPALSAQASANISLTGWIRYLAQGDILEYRLMSVAPASATYIGLSMLLRPTKVLLGTSTVVTAAADTMILASGDTVVMRS